MTTKIENYQKSNLSERTEYKWNGFYRALVLDAHDERQLGRVKVRIPDIMPEDDADSCDEWKKKGLWAHPANNYLGGRNIQDTMGTRADFEDAWYQGSCLIPPKGSWVFVFFENGDTNHPYYFGSGEFGQRKVLPENQQGPEWEKKWTLIKTRKGRCIVISDDEDDCRVEITGKKRLITNEPDGDDDSVFTIDDNQTVIFLDERAGKENLLIKDYRGNFIRMHQDNVGIKDQLHIFFHDDIHIETEKNMFVKTGINLDVDVGAAYKLKAGTTIDRKSSLATKEQALSFDRFAMLTDKRTAGIKIHDTAGIETKRTAGLEVKDTSGIKNLTFAGTEIKEMSGSKINRTTISINDYGVKSKYHGILASSLTSDGPVSVMGAMTLIQCSKPIPTLSVVAPSVSIASLAKSAAPAEPKGARNQEPNPQGVPDPVIATGDSVVPPTNITTPPVGDDYMLTFENQPTKTTSVPPQPPAPQIIIPNIPKPPGGGGTQCTLTGGVGHIFSLLLKDVYRDKIIPLVDKSYGKYCGFSLFRDPVLYGSDSFNYRMDSSYFDPDAIPVYENYRNATDWLIDEDTKWWDNLDKFCIQAKNYNITVVPTLFDFHGSPLDPFITKLQKPYKGINWSDDIQGEYVKLVMQHIKSSGVKYLVNIGYRAYTLNESDPFKLLPDSVYLRNLFTFLIETCSVPSTKMSLTADDSNNLFAKNPYVRYQAYTGETKPSEDQINIEEFVDGHWGGTGRVSVYNDDGALVDGYEYFLRHSCSGINSMANWKMTHFENTIPLNTDIKNVMNYIFAPRQREAMRIVYGNDLNNNGFIDFT